MAHFLRFTFFQVAQDVCRHAWINNQRKNWADELKFQFFCKVFKCDRCTPAFWSNMWPASWKWCQSKNWSWDKIESKSRINLKSILSQDRFFGHWHLFQEVDHILRIISSKERIPKCISIYLYFYGSVVFSVRHGQLCSLQHWDTDGG